MLKAYVFCYTLVYLSFLNNVRFPIEKKPSTADHEFNLKLSQRPKIDFLPGIFTPNKHADIESHNFPS